MKVKLNRVNDQFHFEAHGSRRVVTSIDHHPEDSSLAQGASPMELLLMAVGGCNAIDIIHILEKQHQTIDKYYIEVSGERKEVLEAKPFESIHVSVFLEGSIDPKKALRAAKLSFEKYCSVSITLRDAVKVTFDVTVNGKKIE